MAPIRDMQAPSICSVSERWAQVRTIAASPGRKVDLERIEDEVDAILCAHLAWLWSHRPDALSVYGDVRSGYLVAPPPPEHPPMRRPANTAPTQAQTVCRVLPSARANTPGTLTSWMGAVPRGSSRGHYGQPHRDARRRSRRRPEPVDRSR